MAKILIVDDEKSIRRTLGEFLQGDGYEVIEAEDADTALQRLQEAEFDAVVTDIILPRVTGVELLRRIHATAPHVQVVLMTGEPTIETATEALRAGAADYLFKPISKEAILRVVANAVRLKRLEDTQRRLEAENRAHQANLERLVAERTAGLTAANKSLDASRGVAFTLLERAVIAKEQAEQTTAALQREVTERQQAEAALRESAELIRQLLQTTDQGIYGINRDGDCTFINRAGLQALGYQLEECLGKNMHDLIHYKFPDGSPYPVAECPIFRAKLTGVGCRVDNEALWRKDGVSFPAEYSSYPVLVNGEIRGAVVTFSDITERKQMEAANTLLAAQFRQAQKLEAIGQLAGGIAHDFNNVLAVILGNADLAVMDTDPSHPARASLEEIKKAGVRARDLVQQILTYSRQQSPDRRVIPLEPVIAEAAKFLHATIPSGVEIVLALAASTPPVLADATQIHQTVFNLCTNAWQALEDQPGRITIQLQTVTLDAKGAARLAGLRPGRFACLTISDTGQGMDAATLEHIFNPFFTTKAPGQGTGLGLSVVQGIVAAHDGAITVVSQPGQGTTFQVYFPAAADATAAAGIAPGGPVPQGQGQHVLFLDDEEALVLLATRMLERLGYRVTGFTDAAEAVQAFRANPGQFDVVITDLNMPSTSGLDVARELLTVRPELPVLLCSGHVTEQMKAQAHSAGIRHVLYKPNTMAEVSATLHHLFTQPRQPGPNL